MPTNSQYFNSTMVRLKALNNDSLIKEYMKFQFHYGSVKSCKDPLLKKAFHEFQFHYGSVKRVKEQ